MKIPLSLKTDLLIDTTFEVRFETPVPLSAVLPGILVNEFNLASVNIENFPVQQVPREIRDSNPDLRYSPLLRIDMGEFCLLIGDKCVALGAKMPYPGWQFFRLKILELLACLNKHASYLQNVQRISLKYVDIVERLECLRSLSLSKTLDVNFSVGARDLLESNMSVRTQVDHGDKMLTIVQIITPATVVSVVNGIERNGCIIDLDTIKILDNQSYQEFYPRVEAVLNNLHKTNKELFFRSLTPEAIECLGPVYE